MKRKKLVRVGALLMTVAMTVGLCGCGGGKGSDSDKTTIRVGYAQEDAGLFDELIVAFEDKYPDIKVEKVELSNANLTGATTELTSMAAAGNLPDVMIGNEKFAYVVQQGWAYPLDNLLEADEDRDDVLEMGLDQYTYNGHLYALPWRLQFDSVLVNLDLIDELNLDEPGYDWTMSEFVSLAKAATTDKYSGINYIYDKQRPSWALDTKLMLGMIPNGYEQYGYNFDTHTVDLTVNNAWVDTVKLVQELESVPGLVSDNLKDNALRNEGKADDYDKKFGKDSDALVSGKVLIGNCSSWHLNSVIDYDYNWDFYPVPTKDGLDQRIHTHVDFAYMSSALTEDNYEAAYKFLKFLTYDKDGVKLQMDYSVNRSKDSTYGFSLFIPACENQEIKDAFNALDVAPDGIKYMYNTVTEDSAKAIVSDCDKVVPDFWINVTTYRDEADQKVAEGADPAALVNDLQAKISAAMEESWSFFSDTVDKNLAEFYESHPWEQ